MQLKSTLSARVNPVSLTGFTRAVAASALRLSFGGEYASDCLAGAGVSRYSMRRRVVDRAAELAGLLIE